MIELIVLLLSQCRDSGDIKLIRNMCDLRCLGLSEDYWSAM